MTSAAKEGGEQAFLEMQHRVRGLVANYKSRRFVQDRRTLPHQNFRAGLKEVLLDGRAHLRPEYYRPFIDWTTEQIATQLPDMASIPVGYDDLSGVYGKAAPVSLEHEILWISERLRADKVKLNLHVLAVAAIQDATLAGDYEFALKILEPAQIVLGASLWSVQLRIALENLAGGLERQKQYTGALRSVHRTGLLNFTAYHTSVRNEERTTYSKFMDDIEARITALTRHNDLIKTYDRYRIKGEFASTDSGLAEILRVEQSHGIVDLYETFLAVLQEMARRGVENELSDQIAHCLADIPVDDFRIAKLERFFSSSKEIQLPARSSAISDNLFAGNLRPAIRASRAVSSDDPWQYIYAGFALAGTRDARTQKAARPTEFIHLIARVQSRCEGSDDAWAQLAKLSLNIRGLPLAAGILEFTTQLRRSQPDQEWRPWLVSLNSPYIGAEDRPWDTGCTLGPHSTDPASNAWYEASCPQQSDIRAHRLFRALGHVYRTEFAEADETLGPEDEIWPEALRNLRSLIRLHALHALGERQRVVVLLANEGSRSATHARFLPLVSALGDFTWQDFKAVEHPLAAPIALNLLWIEQESGETASKMRFATGYALRRLGISKPSDLENFDLPVSSHELVYFLRYVCVPEIMDLARLFPGTRAILDERQAICGALVRLDPENEQSYQTEILTIANSVDLDEGRRIVDSTRIHVDSDAFVRWATRELSEDYERYRDLAQITIDSTQTFEDVLRELENHPAQRGSFTPENEADALLFSLLRRLGEEFLSNATFGLDFYLSKRVRHQSFIGLIRGPLEFSDLITTRKTEAGEYHRNEFWISRFDATEDDAKDQIDLALREFSAQFDDILSQAKDTYFHIRSAEKPQGMIVLSLNERTVKIAKAFFSLDFDFPDFARVSVPLFWAAIEGSLVNIRNYITERTKNDLIEQFDIVRAKVRQLAEPDKSWLEFDAAMGGAASEVQRKLDDVAQWFVHADTLRQHKLFSLDQILKIGIETAQISQKGFSPNINQSAKGDLHLHAANLVFVHDVVFVGLGNVRKHSGLKSPEVDINATWNQVDSTLVLTVESDCRISNRAQKTKKAAEIRKLISEGSHDRRTRLEEGSGFAKLAAVVGQSERGNIEFGFTDEGRFRLTVTFAIIANYGSKNGQI